jgi:hypothetical protein
MREFSNQHKNQGGNALFLILIAVVLFAALTYAITQSNRGSGNSSAREGNSVAASSVTQFPAAIRTGITRILMRGFAVTELRYARPADATTEYATFTQQQVFHPDGGGVTWTDPDQQAVTAVADGQWHINSNTGTTAAGIGGAGADTIMFLTNVKGGVCEAIMRQLYNVTAIPAGSTTRVAIIAGASPATGLSNTTAITFNAAAGQGVDGRAFGCFSNGGVNFYFHVLVEQ